MASGRPTKYTTELGEQIVNLVRAGNYVETAANASGVSKNTIYDWMRKGARGDKRYTTFSDAINKAMAQSEMWDLAQIAKASAGGSWQASAWRLERKHPERYGRKDKHEHSGPDGGHIPIGPPSTQGLPVDKVKQLEEFMGLPAGDDSPYDDDES